MPIFKAKIEVIVFLAEPDETQALDALLHLTLTTLSREMDEGSMVGDHTLTSIELVPAGKISEELLAIGSDGDFFETLDKNE